MEEVLKAFPCCLIVLPAEGSRVHRRSHLPQALESGGQPENLLDFGFTPRITLREGLRRFAQWYKEYYKA